MELNRNRSWVLVGGCLLLIWAVSILGFLDNRVVISLGLIPREPQQWWGVFSHVLVHKDWAHLFANSVPLLVMLLLLQLRALVQMLVLLLGAWLLTGFALWCLGRTGLHIGASGLVFALLGIHLANGWFSRTLVDVAVACGVAFAYSGMLFGVLPGQPGVSWEGHLCGLLAGVSVSGLSARWQAGRAGRKAPDAV